MAFIKIAEEKEGAIDVLAGIEGCEYQSWNIDVREVASFMQFLVAEAKAGDMYSYNSLDWCQKVITGSFKRTLAVGPIWEDLPSISETLTQSIEVIEPEPEPEPELTLAEPAFHTSSKTESTGDKAGIDANHIYQYEDYDITAILRARLAEEIPEHEQLGLDDRIQVLAPIDGMAPDELAQQLRANRTEHPGARIIIIPYNVGHYHWIGILLEFNADDQIIRAIYVDSLGQHDLEIIEQRLKDAGYLCKPEYIRLLEQDDGTSCGAYTIENLILVLTNRGIPDPVPNTEAIRRRHLACLEAARPDFYQGPNGFYQRQLTNRVTALNRHFVSGSALTVVFSVAELDKISAIVKCLAQFSNQDLREQLWTALQPKSAYDADKKSHLDEIRRAIKDIANTLIAADKASDDVTHLQKLTKFLFGSEWLITTPFTDELMNRFCVDYELIMAIAKRKNVTAYSTEQQEAQETILKQIKEDEELSKKLQLQFYSKEEDIRTISVHTHTSKVIHPQGVYRIYPKGAPVSAGSNPLGHPSGIESEKTLTTNP